MQRAPFIIVNGRFKILTLLESDQDASGTASLRGPMIGAGLAVPQEELEGVASKEEAWHTLLSLLPPQLVSHKQKKMGCNGTNI